MNPGADLQQATSRYLVRRRRLVFASNGAFLLLLVAAASAVATTLFVLDGSGPRMMPAGIAGSVTLLSAGLAAFLVLHFKEVVEEGRSADGVVTGRWYLRNSWRIEFTYTLDGKDYEDHLGVVAFRPKVKVGDRVTVAVDPTNPKSALLPILLHGRGPQPCLDAEPAQSTPNGTITSFTIRRGAESRALGTLVSVLAEGDSVEISRLDVEISSVEVCRTPTGFVSRSSVGDHTPDWTASAHDDIVSSLKDDLVADARRSPHPITGRYFSDSSRDEESQEF